MNRPYDVLHFHQPNHPEAFSNENIATVAIYGFLGAKNIDCYIDTVLLSGYKIYPNGLHDWMWVHFASTVMLLSRNENCREGGSLRLFAELASNMIIFSVCC